MCDFLVIHSLAHFWNIINFIGNYDSKFHEINWAKDETDVRTIVKLFIKRFFLKIFNKFTFRICLDCYLQHQQVSQGS